MPERWVPACSTRLVVHAGTPSLDDEQCRFQPWTSPVTLEVLTRNEAILRNDLYCVLYGDLLAGIMLHHQNISASRLKEGKDIIQLGALCQSLMSDWVPVAIRLEPLC